MPGPNDGIAKYAFCICAGKERLSDETQLGGVVNVVGLESGDDPPDPPNHHMTRVHGFPMSRNITFVELGGIEPPSISR